MTDATKPAENLLGPSEIARDWGCSRQYVAKCLKAGCPRTSLEEARCWRTERTRFFRSTEGEGGLGRAEEQPAGLGDGDSLESELERVKRLVSGAGKRWADATRAKQVDSGEVAAARRAYQEAVKTRIEIEQLIGDYLRDAGIYVKLPEAQRAIDERLSPFRSALHSFDRVLATELFPDAPQKLRPAIRSVIVRHLLPAVAGAKKRLLGAAGHGSPELAA